MRKLLALLTLAASAWGAQSIHQPGSKFTQKTGATITSASPVRIEARIHGWSGNWTGVQSIIASYGGYIKFTGANQLVCGDFNGDANFAGRERFLTITGMTDVQVRCQRDPAKKVAIFEAWNADGTGYVRSSTDERILTLGAPSNSTITIGDNNSSAMPMEIDFIRIYSTNVEPNSTPPNFDNLVGDVANYEFEGNANDTSGHALNLGTTWGSGGTITYVATNNAYAPFCGSGSRLGVSTYRAGALWSLNGNDTYSASGTVPTFTWQQTAGPNSVKWPDGHKVRNPRISGAVKGEYTFSLQTEADGLTSNCTVDTTVVATDVNGNLVPRTDTESIVGSPVKKDGATRWPLIDVWTKQYLDRMQAMLDAGGISSTTYDESWMTAQAGTVTVSGTAVTGTGTAFLSTVCNGDGSVKSGKSMLLWHGTGTLYTGYSTPYADPKGKRRVTVSSCASDTALTLTAIPKVQTYVKFTGSMQYSVWDDQNDSNYQDNAKPWDYYDNVFAAYDYCYRSGVSSYCALARRIADIQWNLPYVNKGLIYDGDGTPGTAPLWGEERNWAYTGLVMRAMDGAPEMWPGLDQMAKFTEKHFQPDGADLDLARVGNPGDLRNDAYRVIFLSVNYLKTPNTTQKASSLSKLLGAYTRWDNAKQTDGNMIWWVQFIGGDGYDYTGVGAQPYMQAMFGQSLEWMAKAFDAAYAATSDTQYSTKAANIRASWIPGIGHWLVTYGYNTHWGGGLYYARGFGQCEPSPDGVYSTGPEDHQCDMPSAEGARSLAMPAVGFMPIAAKYDPTLQTFATNLVAGVFGKPGSGSYIEDANYASSVDPVTLNKFAGNANIFSKWVGELAGFFTQGGAYEAFLNGIPPADIQTYNVNLNFPPGTTSQTLTLTLPNGTVSNPTCASSPCSISIDRRQGGAKLQIDANNSAGQTIGSATLDLVVP